MTDAEAFEQAGDQLSRVIDALDDVNLNVLTDDNIRQVLDAKADLGDVCDACRQNARALDSPADGGDDE